MWDLIVSVPDHCLSFYFRTLTPVFVFFKVKLLYSSENIQYCILLEVYL